MKNHFILTALVLFFMLPVLFSCKSKSPESSYRNYDAALEKADTTVNQPSLANDINIKTNLPENRKFLRTADIKFKVINVRNATEEIEDLIAQYGGYVTYSHLENREDKSSTFNYGRDSLVNIRQMVVENDMTLQVPNENLDSMVRNLNRFILFLDYRIFKADEVTYDYLLSRKRSERLGNYEKLQQKHIDNQGSKLKETSNAQESLLNKQMQADETEVQRLALEDKVNYSTLNISIYQKAITVKETLPDFNYRAEFKPGFFRRLLDSVIQGWNILEEILLFLIRIWPILLMIGIVIFLAFYFDKKKVE